MLVYKLEKQSYTRRVMKNGTVENVINNGILVIEDNHEMQDLLRLLLEHEGYSMISATTGDDALKILRTTSDFMVVLMDLSLPDMLSETLLNKIKKEGLCDHIPILFFSAISGLKRMDLPEGVVGVIEKPFQVQQFLSTLKTFEKKCCPVPASRFTTVSNYAYF